MEEWAAPPAAVRQIAPGWYPDEHGVTRYWDGTQWTQHVAPPQPVYLQQPVWVQPNVRQAHDRAQYVRQQRGHSIILHAFFGGFLLWIPTIYYAVSPNHPKPPVPRPYPTLGRVAFVLS
jgi:hypothetical protein